MKSFAIVTICIVLLLLSGGTRRGFAQDLPENPPSLAQRFAESTTTFDSQPVPDDLESRFNKLEEQWKKQQAAEEKKKDSDLLKPTIRWTGQVQSDFVWFSQSAANREAVGNAEDGAGFRRARLGATGSIFETTEYRIEMDFAQAGRPTFLDNWVSVRVPNLGTVKAGHFFEPFNLERMTSNRYAIFMERGLPDLFSPKRHTGIGASNTYLDEQGTWAVGGFRSTEDPFGDDFGDAAGWSGTGRVTYLPWYENDGEYLWHVGGAYSYRAISSQQVRFAERPEIRVTAVSTAEIPFFVDTGNIAASHYQLYGLETSLVYSCLSLQSEYVWVPVHRSDGALPNLFYQGAYVLGSWFITGEHRVYRRSTGTFDRMTPHTNAFKGPIAAGNPRGPGAWELAARWSYLDLNSQDVAGGRLNDITIGLNWYLNPYTRITWNYIHAMLDSPVNGDSTADIFGMRFGFEF